MTVLSQTFFALVGSHLVAFSFLSAGHGVKPLCYYDMIELFSLPKGLFCLFNLFHEHFRGLESGDFVFGDDDCCVL